MTTSKSSSTPAQPARALTPMSDHADSIDQLDTEDRTHAMTEQQPSPSPDPAEAYAAEYRRLWDATVATLTAAVQLDHPEHGAVDFSDFLASALGAVEPALRHSQDDPIHAAPLAA